MFDRRGLVSVELIDAALTKHVAETRVEQLTERCVARLERWQTANGCDPPVRRIGAVGGSAGQTIEGGGQRLFVSGIRAARRKHG